MTRPRHPGAQPKEPTVTQPDTLAQQTLGDEFRYRGVLDRAKKIGKRCAELLGSGTDLDGMSDGGVLRGDS